MDGITTTPIEATCTSVVKCYAQGAFRTAAPFIILDSKNKGVTYGPDVADVVRLGVGQYKFTLREPYALLLDAHMSIDGSNAGPVFQFQAQPDLFDALPFGGNSVALPTNPFVIFFVIDTTTGLLAQPPDDVLFTMELTFRNRQIGV